MDVASGTAQPASAHRAVYARMGRNVAWLLGGRGFSGLVSLAYLAIAARALGPEGFGVFTLVLAYGQAIANLAQFQSWQALIRYGAGHLARGDRAGLARLVAFTGAMDVASALVGAAVAVAGVSMAGAWLGWSGAQQGRAALFGGALLLSIGATPVGTLRLFDRFDLITYIQAIGPAVRLAGSLVAWGVSRSVDAFLIVWAAAALVQSAAGWIVSFGPAGQAPQFARDWFGRARAENPGILRFMGLTNLSSSLSLIWEQLGTLAVGGVSGATAAGGFRIASRLAKAMVKPVQTFSRVLFPELARLVASDDHVTLRRVTIRVGWAAIGLSLAVVLVAAFGGTLLLRLVAGRDYAFAHELLLLLAIAAAIELSGFALEPLLTAHGQAGQVLVAQMVGTIVYGALLAILLASWGATGAAWAAIGGAGVVRLALSIAVRRLLAGAPPG